MINYLNILDVWSIIEHGYEPKYNTATHSLTTKSQIDKGLNDYAVNAIFNSISELILLVFGNMTSTRDMWLALLNMFEGNTQIKRTKIMGLEIKFQNFKIEDHESIEEIYNRLLSIQNEFSNLGEPLTNNKVVGKILRVMLRRPRWEALISALEGMQGTNDAFMSDELYTHLRCFEEKLTQAGDYHVEPKQVIFSAQSNVKHFHPSTSHEKFIQSLDHEVSKDAMPPLKDVPRNA
jgi:gag-polypeptide of LTR copia-type